MKGLVLKDLYTVRFQIIGGLLIMLLPNLLFILAGGGMANDPGNEPAELLSVLIFGLLNYMNICLFSSFILNTLKDDINSGWAKIQRTFPVSGSVIILSKLAASGLVVGLLTLLSIVYNLLSAVLFSLNMELMLTMPLCIGFYQMIVLAPLFPLAMRVGVKFTEFLYIITEILVLAVVIVVMTNILNSGGSYITLLRIVFYCGLPLLAAISCVLSYKSGKKAIESFN